MKNLAYSLGKKIGGIKVLKYLARNHPRILMYHRISSSGQGDGISVDMFRQQMQVLARDFNVISLNELVLQTSNINTIPAHSVAITFDDGYEDFYLNAFPVLKELSLPATLFVTTGFANDETWLWPDKIKYLLSHTTLNQFPVPEMGKVFNIKNSSFSAWNAIADYCLTIADKDKRVFIALLGERLGVSLPVRAPEPYKGVNWAQINEMVAQGLDIGSHSVTHPVMTKLAPEELRNELLDSKTTIERQINKPIQGFCYPNGQSEDINENVKQAIKAAGYQYAIAAFPTVNPLADQWAINRYAASSDIKEFEKTIYGFRYQRLSRH